MKRGVVSWDIIRDTQRDFVEKFNSLRQEIKEDRNARDSIVDKIKGEVQLIVNAIERKLL